MRRAAVILACLAAAAAGCGGDESEPTAVQPSPSAEKPADDRAVIKAAIGSYLAALAEGDGKQACSKLTEDLQARIAAEGKQLAAGGCEEVIGKVHERLSADQRRRLALAKITMFAVQGRTATASGTGMAPDVQLVREGDDWRISALTIPAQEGPELPSDPCSLLSRDDVADELGARASGERSDGQVRALAPYVQCVWEIRKDGLVDEKLTVVVVGSPERYGEIAKDPDAEPVEGVGDAAVAFTGAPPFGIAEDDDFGPSERNNERVIVVRAGDRTVLVERNVIDVHEPRDLARRVPNAHLAAIARKVLEGLS